MKPVKYRAWLKEEKKLGQVTKLQWLMLDSEQPDELTFEAVVVRIGLSVYTVFPHEVELMEYTGLKDKNGKEIYESDMVKAYYPDTGKYITDEVIFDTEQFIGYRIGGTRMSACTDFKVVGNKYESDTAI